MAFLEDLRVAQEGLGSLGFWALQVYRFGHLRYRFQSRLVRYPLGALHLVLAKLAEMFCGVTMGVSAKIGRRLVIEHSGAIVVHGHAVIGDDCIIRQGVTIGNQRMDRPFDAPRIGHRFLPQALAFMAAHPEVAGVGGRVVEMNTSSLEYLARVERGQRHMQAGAVDRLDMGGLYRRSAVAQAGYFSDRNLHSYEEFDLAVRLRAKGWTLWRIAMDSVQHHGHDAPPYQLLLRRWRSGYICGLGEVVRAAVGQPHLGLVITSVRELRLYVAVLMWWLVLLVSWALPLPWVAHLALFSAAAALPFVLMTWRKRSAGKAVFSVVSWCFNAAGLVRGLLGPRRPARESVASVQLRNTV